MSAKHTLLILFVVFLLGSAYPTGKLGLNDTIPPILFGALRMSVVFICLIPFFKFQIVEKKFIIPLIGFSICFGVAVNMFLYLSINASSILAPITIGAQLSIPFGIILSSIFLNEKISYKKWLLITTSFFGIVLLAFDPKVTEELIGSLLICDVRGNCLKLTLLRIPLLLAGDGCGVLWRVPKLLHSVSHLDVLAAGR